MGAALSLCGTAMQGLFRNPLADGGTLGISSGGALGAALAIVLNISIPGLALAGSVFMSMVFAFASLMMILSMTACGSSGGDSGESEEAASEATFEPMTWSANTAGAAGSNFAAGLEKFAELMKEKTNGAPKGAPLQIK